MSTVRSASNRNRLVAVASIVVALVTIVVTAALLLPDRTLAQAGEPDQAEKMPYRVSILPSAFWALYFTCSKSLISINGAIQEFTVPTRPGIP